LACYKRAYKQLLPYEDAEGIGVALHNNDAYHSALCNLDQSEIYLELNLIDEAEDLAQTSSEQFKRLGLGYEHLKALTNLGVVLGRAIQTLPCGFLQKLVG
jgi:hypothetical protein